MQTDLLRKDKKTILAISDIPFAATGVGVQFNQLISYLVGTGEYRFYVLGMALKHPDMTIKKINEDFIVQPFISSPDKAFENKQIVRNKLVELQPDAVFIFTDPHQYIYLWEMEDEIHQICPIIYWHVWDNDPYPECNDVWYQGTDLIACISLLTYNLVKPRFENKTIYIPHTFSRFLYYPLPKYAKKRGAEFFFKEKADWFKMLWVNRNGGRKQCLELLESFSEFLKIEGKQKSVLLLRTEMKDPEGPDLNATIERLGIEDNVIVINDKLEYPLMNLLYNASDLVLNVSKAEGFGLTLLTAMNTKTPIAAVMTGGMKEQIVHPETGEKFGFDIPVNQRNLIGSQVVPFIYEDYAARKDIVAAMFGASELTESERDDLVERAYNHSQTWFNYDSIMQQWKEVFDNQIKNYVKTNKWEVTKIDISAKKEAQVVKKQVEQLAALNQQQSLATRQIAEQSMMHPEMKKIMEARAKLEKQMNLGI